jgi:hypothetical protein
LRPTRGLGRTTFNIEIRQEDAVVRQKYGNIVRAVCPAHVHQFNAPAAAEVERQRPVEKQRRGRRPHRGKLVQLRAQLPCDLLEELALGSRRFVAAAIHPLA